MGKLFIIAIGLIKMIRSLTFDKDRLFGISGFWKRVVIRMNSCLPAKRRIFWFLFVYPVHVERKKRNVVILRSREEEAKWALLTQYNDTHANNSRQETHTHKLVKYIRHTRYEYTNNNVDHMKLTYKDLFRLNFSSESCRVIVKIPTVNLIFFYRTMETTYSPIKIQPYFSFLQMRFSILCRVYK